MLFASIAALETLNAKLTALSAACSLPWNHASHHPSEKKMYIRVLATYDEDEEGGVQGLGGGGHVGVGGRQRGVRGRQLLMRRRQTDLKGSLGRVDRLRGSAAGVPSSRSR